eukprot:TRINITY_DN23739_c0_g1_i1.p1 TRINITY_DN23739_c0_g1~~TRINITY_DN23739_c0_g1_i1.p1  ORF type:complete len:408 (+),score=74.59 TRINITY_DN23739_c0_g1_i1:39-1262(+)
MFIADTAMQQTCEHASRSLWDKTVRSLLEQCVLLLNGAYQKDMLLQGGLVKAVRLGFQIEELEGYNALRLVKEAWDRRLEVRNAASSYKARKAWHTSTLWEQLAAEERAFESVRNGLLLTTFFGVLLFALVLRNVVLVTATTLSSLSAVLLQCAILVGPCGWKLGAVEGVVLVAFTGYMLQLQLRVALAYADTPLQAQESSEPAAADAPAEPRDSATSTNGRAASEDRQRRVQLALKESASQILLSVAFGVIIGCLMVLPGGLLTRNRAGGALISCCTVSAIHALLFMPAFLLLVGPTPLGFDVGAYLRDCLTARKQHEELQKAREAAAGLSEPEGQASPRGSSHQRYPAPSGPAGEVLASGDHLLLRGGATARPSSAGSARSASAAASSSQATPQPGGGVGLMLDA